MRAFVWLIHADLSLNLIANLQNMLSECKIDQKNIHPGLKAFVALFL